MRNSLILLGSTDVTVVVAEAAIAAGASLRAIVTIAEQFQISYSDKPVRNFRSVNLNEWALRNSIEVIPFSSYEAVLAQLGEDRPDVCLVAGWYHMVPQRFREAFQRGCYGFHASLLPDLRGGAPLNWAILSGREETGVTLFEMNDGVDEGLIFGQARFPVGPRTTIGELVVASRDACGGLTRACLPGLLTGTLAGHPQSGPSSYGLQRIPEDGRIDWKEPAWRIDRLIRAVGRPYPGATTALGAETIRIWAADLPASCPPVFGAPGQIARLAGYASPLVVTGEGMLAIHEATGEDGSDCLDKLLKSGHKRLTS